MSGIDIKTQMTDRPTPGRPPKQWYGELAGVAATALALGLGELVAAATGGPSAPLVAVGGVAVDAAPTPVKEFAVAVFYTYDKLALQAGIVLVLAVFAAFIGVLAMRRLWYGLAGVAVFGMIGVLASATRPSATWAYPLPTVAGALAAAGLLVLLRRTLPRRAAVSAQDLGDDTGPDTDVAAPGTHTPLQGASSRSSDTGISEVDGAGRPPGRRRFLALAVGAIGAAAVAVPGGRRLWAQRVAAARAAVVLPSPSSPAAPLPAKVSVGVPGVEPFVTSTSNFYRIDTALTVPQMEPKDWRLRIHGRVKRPLTLTYEQLLTRPLVERYITLACVSNEVGGELVGNARWLGVPIKDLLDEVEPDDRADQVVSRSVDGYTAGTPTAALRDGRDALLAVGMNGEPLPVEHGFPVRMVVPGLYGYVSATKWLTELELSRFSDFSAYWVRRDYAALAPVKTQSRIDTPAAGKRLKQGLVMVAGVAWAQHRGVSAVEVRVDDGPWQQAQLAAVPSADTWRQWSWPWQATPGEHRLQVRATDNTGQVQTGQVHKPSPDGATGRHTIKVTVA
ncbi:MULTISPECIES: molybdopterin-dependent oxidoreductase [unclassified Streptomyces]|uniref:molybdopterin-dependent oxidoreductase n=1 Tax=unclassified Streptomyces TaxID=2593676 RepID=UPI00224EE4AF|nr:MULTISPECIES: molybdopterin-dependent oxidoreductase [unclassified Streptomyces]MCX5264441.1 molybdopterin-dependent oxidoreductase [Streptomyces sp. NBC_00199]